MDYATRANDLWCIILAGGEGERLRPFMERWLGRHRPKQYCAFVGTRSMFQHTLDRADRLCQPEQKVIVTVESQRPEILSQLDGRRCGKLIVQPANRDTAAGVYAAASFIRASNPRATVVLFPSDHFVYPEEPFLRVLQCAERTTRLLPNHLVLLAAVPDRAETEYGWIHPGPSFGWMGGQALRQVKAFVEKPSPQVAHQALWTGALWNTLVLAAKVETLWRMGWRYLSEMMPLFERYGEAIGSSKEVSVLEAVYRKLPERNFSAHLLQHISQHIAVLEIAGVLWSDWGKLERIVDSLQRLGKPPAFPYQHAMAPGNSLPDGYANKQAVA